jgi:hypothetical protein
LSKTSSRLAPYATAFTVALLLISGCSPSTTASSPKPTTTFQPEVTILEPSVTPSRTPAPTDTVLPPTPTSVPTPSPDQINPFTGLVVTDTAVLNRRPVLVKVANTSEVRPQDGLAQADVVVEHYAEGGITRFSALFLTNSPEKVGSVRSCRLIDLELPAIFGSSLTCSGTSLGVRALMLQSNYLFDQDGDPNDSVAIESDFGPYECSTCPMFRTSDRPMPHNLFANTPNIWKELDKRGKNTRTEFKSWTFDAAPITSTAVVSEVNLPYMVDAVTWKYDDATKGWLRFTDGISHTDAQTGEQLNFANVLVLYVPHTYTSIQEDANGSRSISIELWGQGDLRLYRDGRRVDGTWERVDGSTYQLDLKDASGAAIPLRPGQTWIEVVPLDFKVSD